MSLRQRVLGPEHPDTLTSRYNLALALAHQEKWREARVVAEVAEAGFRWVLGDGHPPLIRWMRSGWWSY